MEHSNNSTKKSLVTKHFLIDTYPVIRYIQNIENGNNKTNKRKNKMTKINTAKEDIINIQLIKKAVDQGKTVHWGNEGYTVAKCRSGQYNIIHYSGNCIGLTNKTGDKLNGSNNQFYIAQ